ncbi:MAG: LysR family transcriptional regulator [Verrucomicrobiota bacterium]
MDNILDSRQLKAFYQVAHTGSFTKAAVELELTQSAISHAIKSLEENLKCSLFDKIGKKAVLNQAGEQLLLRTHKIFKEMQEAHLDIQHLNEWGRGRIRIGASTTACQYILPNVLREFKESFPKYSISIEPISGNEGVELLVSNQIDIAFTLQPWMENRVDFREVFVDEMTYIVSPFHPWATVRRASILDIPKQKFILYPRQSYTYKMIESYFSKDNISLPPALELGSMEAIKELIKIGMGIGILAPWIAAKELKEGTLVSVSLGKRKLKRHWGIATLKTKRLSLAEETFSSLCKTFSEQLLSQMENAN